MVVAFVLGKTVKLRLLLIVESVLSFAFRVGDESTMPYLAGKQVMCMCGRRSVALYRAASATMHTEQPELAGRGRCAQPSIVFWPLVRSRSTKEIESMYRLRLKADVMPHSR